MEQLEIHVRNPNERSLVNDLADRLLTITDQLHESEEIGETDLLEDDNNIYQRQKCVYAFLEGWMAGRKFQLEVTNVC